MLEHIAQAKVTQRKQIAIPKSIRDILGGLEEGDFILFFEEDGRVFIKKGILTIANSTRKE